MEKMNEAIIGKKIWRISPIKNRKTGTLDRRYMKATMLKLIAVDADTFTIKHKTQGITLLNRSRWDDGKWEWET